MKATPGAGARAETGDRSRATAPPGSGPSPHPEHFLAPAGPTSPAAGGLLFFFLNNYLPTWSSALRRNSANSLIEGSRAAGALPRAPPQDGAPPSLPALARAGGGHQQPPAPTSRQGDGHCAALAEVSPHGGVSSVAGWGAGLAGGSLAGGSAGGRKGRCDQFRLSCTCLRHEGFTSTLLLPRSYRTQASEP